MLLMWCSMHKSRKNSLFLSNLALTDSAQWWLRLWQETWRSQCQVKSFEPSALGPTKSVLNRIEETLGWVEVVHKEVRIVLRITQWSKLKEKASLCIKNLYQSCLIHISQKKWHLKDSLEMSQLSLKRCWSNTKIGTNNVTWKVTCNPNMSSTI